jgi:hypothetical protein
MQADRRDCRCQHATGEAVQDLRDKHRQFARLDRQQQGGNDDASEGAGCGCPLVAHRVDQNAGGELADQRRDGAEGEHEADVDLGPFVRRQIDGDERTEAGLHIRNKKVDEIERPVSAWAPRSETMRHEVKGMAKRDRPG